MLSIDSIHLSYMPVSKMYEPYSLRPPATFRSRNELLSKACSSCSVSTWVPYFSKRAVGASEARSPRASSELWPETLRNSEVLTEVYSISSGMVYDLPCTVMVRYPA